MASKKNLITIAYLQEIILKQMGVKIKYDALKKILKEDLSLDWKRLRHQDLYVNSWKNIEMRRIFAHQMIK